MVRRARAQAPLWFCFCPLSLVIITIIIYYHNFVFRSRFSFNLTRRHLSRKYCSPLVVFSFWIHRPATLGRRASYALHLLGRSRITRAFGLSRQVRPCNNVLFTCERLLYARPAMSSPKSSDRKSSARKQSFSHQRSSNEDIYQQDESYDTPVSRDRARLHKYLSTLNGAHNHYYDDDNMKIRLVVDPCRAGYGDMATGTLQGCWFTRTISWVTAFNPFPVRRPIWSTGK